MPPGRDLIEIADLAGLQAGPQRAQGGVEPLDVSHGIDEAGTLERVDQLPRLLDVRGERLLDQGRDTGRRELQAGFEVIDRPCGHYGEVETVVDHLGDCRNDLGCTSRAVLVPGGIGYGDERDSVEGVEEPGVVASDHPDADEAGAKLSHVRPLPPRAC